LKVFFKNFSTWNWGEIPVLIEEPIEEPNNIHNSN